ncbi:hypothetical protein GF374_02575 [Candidatus Woesearchaeota archaeon]|nr:hypothetical protein [Candidatus Woesearchaeota archaeon]
MVERYFNPKFKGKFEGVEKFLYEAINRYKAFLDENNITYSEKELVRCMKFLKTGIFDRFNAQTNLNLFFRYKNDNILEIEISKGLGKHDPIMIYLNNTHIDDLYESDVSLCEDYEEKGDSEETINGKWIRYFNIKPPVTAPETPTSEQMPYSLPNVLMLPSKANEPKTNKSKLEEILKGLRSIKFKN